MAKPGLDASPISEILIEQSIAGWKEFELEVMRDRADNCVVICSIENVDPMGVHTGDSITVAPAQTLSDVEYQAMRDAAFACIRRVGVETGGSNVQFALDPDNGEMVIIEMNPRVSRSSRAGVARPPGSRSPRSPPAWRSATRSTRSPTTSPARPRPASSRSSTTSSPRCPAGRSRSSRARPTSSARQMQSVGEAMAIGRTFPESLQKALRSLEHGRLGLNCDPGEGGARRPDRRRAAGPGGRSAPPTGPSSSRPRCGAASPSTRWPSRTKVDPWFLDQILMITEERGHLAERTGFAGMDRAAWRRAKRLGFADAQLAWLWEVDRGRRCAPPASPPACGPPSRPSTPAPPSSRPRRRTTTRPTRTRTRSARATGRKVVILGSGPNRIGQGIEFDYCCVHASFALARRRLRDDHGQLQPRDRVDRLRHERPPLLRAAHPRGRAQRHRGRAGQRARWSA